MLKVLRRITKELFKSDEDHCSVIIYYYSFFTRLSRSLSSLITELDYSNNFKATRQWGENNKEQFLRTNTSTVYCSSLRSKGIRMEVRHPDNDVC